MQTDRPATLFARLSPEAVDQIRLNFNQDAILVLNFALAMIMYGIALDINPSDFRRLLSNPRSMLAGLIAQFLLLPAITVLVILILRPQPSLALGMILVASCPGGNISNLITHLARGNTALSVSMTAVSTVIASIMTPVNLAFWGSLLPETRSILKAVHLDPLHLFGIIFLILGLPLLLGILTARRFPGLAARMRMPFRRISIVFFALFVAGALAANLQHFLNYIHLVLLLVLAHNTAALLSGYGMARLFRLDPASRRAVTLEVGIQNSGLGLALIFNFFDGLGGMAILTAWWGIWHMLAGLGLAYFWKRRRPAVSAV